MISINQQQLDSISKQLDSKQTSGKNNSTLYPLYAFSLTNLTDFTKNFSTYEMSHWINNNDRWIHNRNSQNTIGYKRGRILFIDLGATNFRYEPSFTHPCIVIAQNRDFILIIPCSSKKYGKGFPEIIDATPSDCFSCNTGIQTKSFRWVSKNRVISSIGFASSRILNLIDQKLLSLIPTYQKELILKNSKISQLTNELHTANESILNLQNSLSSKERELALLKKSLSIAENRTI